MDSQQQTLETPNSIVARFIKISDWYETYLKPILEAGLYFVGLWAAGLFALSYFQIKYGLGSLTQTIGLLLICALVIPLVLNGLKPFFRPTDKPRSRVASLIFVALIAFGATSAALMKASDEVASYREAELEDEMRASLRTTDPSILVLSRLTKEVIPHLKNINGELAAEPSEIVSLRSEIKQLQKEVGEIEDAVGKLSERLGAGQDRTQLRLRIRQNENVVMAPKSQMN